MHLSEDQKKKFSGTVLETKKPRMLGALVVMEKNVTHYLIIDYMIFPLQFFVNLTKICGENHDTKQ